MKHKINLENIKNYISGNTKMFLKQIGALPDHMKEQIAFRALNCKDCLSKGKCSHCGCSLPGRFYSTSSCNNGTRFPDLMNEEDWDKYKAEKEITNE